MASFNVLGLFTLFHIINIKSVIQIFFIGKVAIDDYMTPIIKPNNPNAEPKISITNIFINVEGSYASAKTQLLPDIPTHTPQMILDSPTPIPVHNNAREA